MALMTDKPNGPSPARNRRGMAAGRLRRPAQCTLTIPPAVLNAYDFRDQAHAHHAGMCARLYSAARRGLVDPQ